MPILAYLLARFSEPSSYAGLGAALAVLGLQFSDTIVGQLAQCLAAGCALAALFLKERGIIKSLLVATSLAAAVTLAACRHPADTAKEIDPKLTAACDAAIALSTVAGSDAASIEAGCGTAEAITKLAQDPASTAWVEKLVADVDKYRAAK